MDFETETIKRFQSSPGPKAGRYGCCGDHDSGGDDVSILARPEGRALRLAGAG